MRGEFDSLIGEGVRLRCFVGENALSKLSAASVIYRQVDRSLL